MAKLTKSSAAWLNLRVYDVTSRIFDGTNAHAYFDQPVSRTDRQWFFLIGKPTSTAIVEIGLKSQEGYFVRVARSGRADFPRVEAASGGGVEWLTVHAATGPVGEPAANCRVPSGDRRAPEPAAHVEPVRVWDIRRTHAGLDGEWIIRDESFGTWWEGVFESAATLNSLATHLDGRLPPDALPPGEPGLSGAAPAILPHTPTASAVVEARTQPFPGWARRGEPRPSDGASWPCHIGCYATARWRG